MIIKSLAVLMILSSSSGSALKAKSSEKGDGRKLDYSHKKICPDTGKPITTYFEINILLGSKPTNCTVTEEKDIGAGLGMELDEAMKGIDNVLRESSKMCQMPVSRRSLADMSHEELQEKERYTVDENHRHLFWGSFIFRGMFFLWWFLKNLLFDFTVDSNSSFSRHEGGIECNHCRFDNIDAGHTKPPQGTDLPTNPPIASFPLPETMPPLRIEHHEVEYSDPHPHPRKISEFNDRRAARKLQVRTFRPDVPLPCIDTPKVILHDTFGADKNGKGWQNAKVQTVTGLNDYYLNAFYRPTQRIKIPDKADFMSKQTVVVEIDFYEIGAWVKNDRIKIFIAGEKIILKGLNGDSTSSRKGVTKGGLVWDMSTEHTNAKSAAELHKVKAIVPPSLLTTQELKIRFKQRRKPGKVAGIKSVKVTVDEKCAPRADSVAPNPIGDPRVPGPNVQADGSTAGVRIGPVAEQVSGDDDPASFAYFEKRVEAELTTGLNMVMNRFNGYKGTCLYQKEPTVHVNLVEKASWADASPRCM